MKMKFVSAIFFYIPAEELYLAAIGLFCTAENFQRSGFSRAVSAEQGEYFAAPYGKIQAAQDIRRIPLIAEPHIFHLYCVFTFCRRIIRQRSAATNVERRKKTPALTHSERRFACAERRGYPRAGREARAYRMLPERGADISWAVKGNQPAAIHDGGAIGYREKFLKPVLGYYHRYAEVAVQPVNIGNEI